jgi:hypothetical protein
LRSREAHRTYHQSELAGGRSLWAPVFAVRAQVGGATSPTFSLRNLDSLSISTSEGTSSGVGIEFPSGVRGFTLEKESAL